MSDWKLELYDRVSLAVRRRPGESIMTAAHRVRRRGVLGQAYTVASVIIRNEAAKGPSAWGALQRALVKARLDHHREPGKERGE